LEKKVQEVCTDIVTEQCTFKQFENICRNDENIVSKYALITFKLEASDNVKEIFFSEIVILYFKI